MELLVAIPVPPPDREPPHEHAADLLLAGLERVLPRVVVDGARRRDLGRPARGRRVGGELGDETFRPPDCHTGEAGNHPEEPLVPPTVRYLRRLL